MKLDESLNMSLKGARTIRGSCIGTKHPTIYKIRDPKHNSLPN
jgi:hypothetical protein